MSDKPMKAAPAAPAIEAVTEATPFEITAIGHFAVQAGTPLDKAFEGLSCLIQTAGGVVEAAMALDAESIVGCGLMCAAASNLLDIAHALNQSIMGGFLEHEIRLSEAQQERG